jgi:hypothetical protein
LAGFINHALAFSTSLLGKPLGSGISMVISGTFMEAVSQSCTIGG